MRHVLNVATLLGIAAMLVTGGCMTAGGGASDEDQINALLGKWKEAILAKDAGALMATFSGNFSHDGYEYEADDKAALREYIDGSIAQGGFDDVEVSMESVEIVIEGGKATVYPIDYSNWEGSVAIELTLAKEETGWLITDMAIEGL